MKYLLMGLLTSGISSWVTTRPANAEEQVVGDRTHVIVRCDGEGVDGKNVFVIDAASAGDGDFLWVSDVDDEGDDDGRSEKQKRRVILRTIGGGKDGGWLGVSIGNVSEALADQLDLDGKGVIIQNVVEDSPADEGGLRAHDVILSINLEDVNGDVGRAIKLIKEKKPGDDVDIIVLRDGREKELRVTLGSREGRAGKFLWKFDRTPDAEVEDTIHTFGRIMRRDDDGEWVIEDLDDLRELKDLPKNLRMFIPKSGSRSTQIFLNDGERTVKTRVERDGNVIVIERDGDGEITVSRVDEDGNETENV